MIYYYDFTLLISTNFLPVYCFVSVLTTLHNKCSGCGQKFALMVLCLLNSTSFQRFLRINQESAAKATKPRLRCLKPEFPQRNPILIDKTKQILVNQTSH